MGIIYQNCQDCLSGNFLLELLELELFEFEDVGACAFLEGGGF